MEQTTYYTAGHLMRAANIHRQAHDQWKARRFLKSTAADQGPGWTRYTFEDVLHAALLAHFTRHYAIAVSEAALIADLLIVQYRHRHLGGARGGVVAVSVDHDGAWTAVNHESPKQKSAIVIRLDAFARDVRRALEQATSEDE